MVPGELRVLPELPRNRNGKLDRALLRTLASEPPAIEPLAAGSPSAEPPSAQSPPVQAPAAHLTGDPLTAQVTAAWAEVLGRPTVPSDVNFFDLGGHSLAMFKLQDALEQHCGLRPSIVALFQETTVTAQVALIRAGREQGEDASAGSSAEAARRARTARLRQQRARKGVSR
jgi:acyl carrier protein